MCNAASPGAGSGIFGSPGEAARWTQKNARSRQQIELKTLFVLIVSFSASIVRLISYIKRGTVPRLADQVGG
jgi:hypothetical protein